MSPKITVVTISYNARNYIEQTILSVVRQDYDNVEYIIIDGGSTDGTVDIIKKYDDRLSLWLSETDKGIYDAMNKGIENATGQYTIFMNAGDYFYDDRVLSNVSQQLDADIVTGAHAGLDENQKLRVEYEPQNITFKYLFLKTLHHQASFIRTELLKKYKYDESLRIASDWKFFLQTIILDNCSVKILRDVIDVYDKFGISATQKELGDKERADVLRALFPQRILEDYRLMPSTDRAYIKNAFKLFLRKIGSKIRGK